MFDGYLFAKVQVLLGFVKSFTDLSHQVCKIVVLLECALEIERRNVVAVRPQLAFSDRNQLGANDVLFLGHAFIFARQCHILDFHPGRYDDHRVDMMQLFCQRWMRSCRRGFAAANQERCRNQRKTAFNPHCPSPVF